MLEKVSPKVEARNSKPDRKRKFVRDENEERVLEKDLVGLIVGVIGIGLVDSCR